MSKIHILENSLANMIAAGEVVERPSSVIKELVENSIDAHAHNIQVSLFEAGRKKIVVEDDGDGMDREDAVLAFKRHATSKIATSYDLFKIKTLGFRGEALPSIASVSRTTLITSTGSGVGSEVVIEDDELTVKDAPLRQGTIVSVEELFYNTPARLKYLKADFTENSNSIEMMCRLALAHPEVSFAFYIDERKQFQTTGRGELLEVIKDIYGHDVAKKMVPFHFVNADFAISGYLGKPELAKASRYFIITLLNGRNVYMPKVQTSIIESYHDFIPPTRFPFVVLSFAIEPALVDVNVHPSKKEVRFSKEADLRLALLQNIPLALREKNLVTEIVTTSKTETLSEQMNFDLDLSPKTEVGPQSRILQPSQDIHPLAEDAPAFNAYVAPEKTLTSLKAVAQLQLTYIVAEGPDGGFYLIDQHAANERINYEKLQRLFNKDLVVTEPLIPIIITITPSEVMLFSETKMALLRAVGLEFEPFGVNAYKVTQIPVWAKEYDEKAYVDELVYEVLHEDRLDIFKLRTHVIATMSCKRSVKANDRLSLADMQYLLDNLLKCDNPHACPHGRPTIIHFNKYELEKMFKRTGV